MKRILAALLLVSASASADIAPMPFSQADSARPMQDAKTVSMAKEEVVVTLHDGFAVVDATFQMANAGAATTIDVGFPGSGVMVEGGMFRTHRPLLGFTAKVSGKTVESKTKTQEFVTRMGPPGRQYEKRRSETWHTFPVTFPKGQTITVRVTYAVLADAYRGESWGTNQLYADGSVAYVLSTGAGWAGNIGEAVIRVRTTSDLSLQFVAVRDYRMPVIPTGLKGGAVPSIPSYARRDKSEIVLTRKAFEPAPNDNIEVVYAWTPRLDWERDSAARSKMQDAAAKAAAKAAR